MTPVIDLQHSIVHGQSPHPFTQALIAFGTESIQTLVIDPERQHEMPEQLFRTTRPKAAKEAQ